MKPKTDTKGSKGLEAELRRHSLLPPKRVGSAQQRRPFRDVRPKRGEGPLPALPARQRLIAQHGVIAEHPDDDSLSR